MLHYIKSLQNFEISLITGENFAGLKICVLRGSIGVICSILLFRKSLHPQFPEKQPASMSSDVKFTNILVQNIKLFGV